MIARFKAWYIGDIRLKVKMLQALDAPIITDCSEVWAPALLQRSSELEEVLANPVQQVHTTFLWQLGGLRASVSSAAA
jgi:hypothetical protein